MKNRTNQRRRALARAGGLFPSLLVAALISACSNTKAEPSAGKVVETNTDPDVFTMQNPGQFPVTTVEARKVSDEIHVNGVIAPDVNRSVPVVSLGGGRVVEIKAKLGDHVQKGQVLLLINRNDRRSADYWGNGRALARQPGVPVHHRRPVGGMGALRCLPGYAVARSCR